MPCIKNTAKLIAHGQSAVRQAALSIIEKALAGADPYRAVHRLIDLNGDRLRIGEVSLDLSRRPRIFVLGAGKATYPIALALEEILGDRISDGVVICKHGQQGALQRSDMLLAAHPIPDEAGFEGARRSLELARRTGPGDIVLCCYTGGSSALLPYPVPGISLDEKKTVNRLLLSCGANIVEINAVRKHLSRVKGGRLAAAVHSEAVLVNLTVSDVIGDPLDYITDPTVPDTSTLEDARATLSRYGLWERVPLSVARHLKEDGKGRETPKPHDFSRRALYSYILVPGDAACVAAADAARALGFATMILSTRLEGESAELGRTFAAVAREIAEDGRPLKPPCVVVGGGETTVKIDEEFGLGGPNQEFALAAAPGIAASEEVLIAGIDSDGTDGPTDLAGGLVDGATSTRAREAGIDLDAHLRRHDVTRVLMALGDAIETGATGTNVNDLKLLVVGRSPKPRSHS